MLSKIGVEVRALIEVGCLQLPSFTCFVSRRGFSSSLFLCLLILLVRIVFAPSSLSVAPLLVAHTLRPSILTLFPASRFSPIPLLLFPFLYPLPLVPSPCQNHQYQRYTILSLSSLLEKESSRHSNHLPLPPDSTSCATRSWSGREHRDADHVSCTWRGRSWGVWDFLCYGFC